MSKIRLHLDEDISIKQLYKQLISSGHDVTRTPSELINRNATDEEQLLYAINQKRCIVTHNIRDFILLSQKYSKHYGIIFAVQKKWSLPQLIKALNLLLSNTQAEQLKGKIHWLQK